MFAFLAEYTEDLSEELFLFEQSKLKVYTYQTQSSPSKKKKILQSCSFSQLWKHLYILGNNSYGSIIILTREIHSHGMSDFLNTRCLNLRLDGVNLRAAHTSAAWKGKCVIKCPHICFEGTEMKLTDKMQSRPINRPPNA